MAWAAAQRAQTELQWTLERGKAEMKACREQAAAQLDLGVLARMHGGPAHVSAASVLSPCAAEPAPHQRSCSGLPLGTLIIMSLELPAELCGLCARGHSAL